MTYKPFKMKGSPMQRNFGVRTPIQAKDDKQSEESKMQAALIQRAYSKWNKANPNASQDEWVAFQSKMMKKKDLTVKKVDDMFAGPKKEAVSTDPKEKK
jgi:hypothetical protein